MAAKKSRDFEVTGEIIGGIYAELQPYTVVRRIDGHRVFGLKPSALDALIEDDEIPKPIKFGKRASGWTGHQINEYHREKIKENDKKTDKQASDAVPSKKLVNKRDNDKRLSNRGTQAEHA